MQLLKAALGPVVRSAVRHLVPIVSSRPWLVAIAARLFAAMPSLKRRLRYMVSGPAMLAPPVSRSRPLSAEEARVLFDLRDAVQRRAVGRGQ